MTTDLPTPRMGPIPDYQRHNIASCAAAGYPIERIALATGLPEDTIARQIREPNEHMQTLINHYRFQQNCMMIKFKMETAELIDEGLRFVRSYVRDGADARLRWDMTKDIFSAHGLIFPRDRAAAPQVNTQLNIYGDDRTLQVMQQAADSIKASSEALRGSLPSVGNITSSRHVHISEAEITPPPAHTDPAALQLEDTGELKGPSGGNGSNKSQ